MPMFKGEVAVPYRASAKLGWCLTLGGAEAGAPCSDVGAVPSAVLSSGTLPMGAVDEVFQLQVEIETISQVARGHFL